MPVINQDLLVRLQTENKDAGLKELSTGLRQAREEFVQLSRQFGETSTQAQNAGTKVNFFSTELQKSKIALKDVSAQTQSTGSGFKDMVGGVHDVMNAFKGLIALQVAKELINIGKELYNVVKEGAQVSNIENAFRGSAKDLEMLETAAGGTMTKLELLKLVNKDLGLSFQEQAGLLGLARLAARQYGGDVQEYYTKLVNVTEGRKRGVKDLNIETAKYTEAVKQLVKEEGGLTEETTTANGEKEITIKNLDAETQKRINLKALFIASGKDLNDLTHLEKDNAEKTQEVANSLDDVADAFKKAFSEDVINRVEGFNKSMKDAGITTNNTKSAAEQLASEIGHNLLPTLNNFLMINPLTMPFGLMLKYLDDVAIEVIKFGQALKDTWNDIWNGLFTFDKTPQQKQIDEDFKNRGMSNERKKEIEDLTQTRKKALEEKKKIDKENEDRKKKKKKTGSSSPKEKIDLKKQESENLTEILNKQKESLDLLDLEKDGNAEIVTKRKELLQTQLQELKTNYLTLQYTSDKVKNLDAQKKLQEAIEKSLGNQVKATQQLSKNSDKTNTRFYSNEGTRSGIKQVEPTQSLNIKTVKADEVTTKTIKAERTETKEQPKGGDASSGRDRASRASDGTGAKSSRVQNITFESVRSKTEEVMTSISSGLSTIQRAFHMENDKTMSALIDNVNQFLGVIQVVKSVIDSIKAVETFMSFLGLAFADGGYVSGAGSSTSDSIPARLSNGEFVVNADSTAKYLPLLKAMNNKNNSFAEVGKYAMGGMVHNYNQSEKFELADVILKGSDLHLSWKRQDKIETRRKG